MMVTTDLDHEISSGRLHPSARDDNDNPVLLTFIQQGDTERVRSLIEKGADPNTCCRAGYPMIVHAALRGDEEMVKLLARLKANLNTHDQTDERRPVLYHSLLLAYAGDPAQEKMVNLLIQLGADLNAVDGRERRLLPQWPVPQDWAAETDTTFPAPEKQITPCSSFKTIQVGKNSHGPGMFAAPSAPATKSPPLIHQKSKSMLVKFLEAALLCAQKYEAKCAASQNFNNKLF